MEDPGSPTAVPPPAPPAREPGTGPAGARRWSLWAVIGWLAAAVVTGAITVVSFVVGVLSCMDGSLGCRPPAAVWWLGEAAAGATLAAVLVALVGPGWFRDRPRLSRGVTLAIVVLPIVHIGYDAAQRSGATRRPAAGEVTSATAEEVCWDDVATGPTCAAPSPWGPGWLEPCRTFEGEVVRDGRWRRWRLEPDLSTVDPPPHLPACGPRGYEGLIGG